jgi:DNA-binding transcriptional ArsR family regulator
MRRNTEATIGELATAVGKSRSSIVAALHRLREAGLAESADGRWHRVEEPPPREPAAKWVRPLNADREERAPAPV